jgi:hypothetical protein
MSALVFLLGALLVASAVVAVLWWRDRQTTSLEDGIDEFHRELQALAPDWKPTVRRSARPRNGGRPG